MTLTSLSTQADDRLRLLVESEDRRLLATVAPPHRQTAFMEIARAIDAGFIHLWLTSQSQAQADRDMLRWLYALGTDRALRLFLDDWESITGAPLAPSVQKSEEWADSVIQCCGNLGICEYILGLVRSHILECAALSRTTARFQRTSECVGLEWFDRADFDWWRSEVSDSQRALRTLLDQAEPDVRRLMADRVSPWREHFIAYTTDPEIDDHFDQEAVLAASRMPGVTEFPPASRFGGIEYRRFVDVLTLLLGWALKHLGFVDELINKDPSLNPRDLTTIFCDARKLIATVACVVGIDEEEAITVVDALTLRASRTDSLCGIPGSAPPPLIAFSDHQLVRLIAGCLGNPFVFLLNSLRSRYRSDWDRAVDGREAVFREQIYAMFPQPHMIKVPGPIRLRSNGIDVTDIDAALVNLRGGIVALFQLKWQDYFGHSTRQRDSQKRNLLLTGNSWIDRVSRWIDTNGIEGVGSVMRLSTTDVRSIHQVRLFVVGRNAAHFSGADVPDDRAAWCSWRQFQRLVATEYDGTEPVNWLFNAVQRDSPRNKELPATEAVAIRVRDLEIILDGNPGR